MVFFLLFPSKHLNRMISIALNGGTAVHIVHNGAWRGESKNCQTRKFRELAFLSDALSNITTAHHYQLLPTLYQFSIEIRFCLLRNCSFTLHSSHPSLKNVSSIYIRTTLYFIIHIHIPITYIILKVYNINYTYRPTLSD